MSTFSHFRSVAPRKEILCDPNLLEIAEAHGRSVVQIVLRWMYQQNIILIPKTWDPNHLAENISIFFVKISSDLMHYRHALQYTINLCGWYRD